MISLSSYCLNLKLCYEYRHVNGCIVECGVWRGGMVAGIAEVLGNKRKYYLCDSFEGLPKAKEIDGKTAIEWQNNINGDRYFDNCLAVSSFSEVCMKKSGAKDVEFIAGWFEETLPKIKFQSQIAILRLDADWYNSTMECLTNLFNNVAKGGLIILDDYHVWDGCSRATHDFLSNIKSDMRIYQYRGSNIHYMIKK